MRYATKRWAVTALAMTVLLFILVGRWFIAVIPGAAFVCGAIAVRLHRKYEAHQQAKRREFWLKRLADR